MKLFNTFAFKGTFALVAIGHGPNALGGRNNWKLNWFTQRGFTSYRRHYLICHRPCRPAATRSFVRRGERMFIPLVRTCAKVGLNFRGNSK